MFSLQRECSFTRMLSLNTLGAVFPRGFEQSQHLPSPGGAVVQRMFHEVAQQSNTSESAHRTRTAPLQA